MSLAPNPIKPKPRKKAAKKPASKPKTPKVIKGTTTPRKPRKSLLTAKERKSYVLSQFATFYRNRKAAMAGILVGGGLVVLGFIAQRCYGHNARLGVYDSNLAMACAGIGVFTLSSIKVWIQVFRSMGKTLIAGFVASGFVLFIETSMIFSPSLYFAIACGLFSFAANSLAMASSIVGDNAE